MQQGNASRNIKNRITDDKERSFGHDPRLFFLLYIIKSGSENRISLVLKTTFVYSLKDLEA
jgi:hypothetical protein